MANETLSTQTPHQFAAHEMLIVNLRNAHALEKQTIAVLQGQLTLLEDYPDLHTRVSEHIVESRDQARRLEAGLEACGSSASMFKDALLSVMGMGQSSVQGFGDDAVLKAVVADTMTEHLEIATYRTLIQLAELAGKPELRPRLEASLREEEAMAAWLGDNLESITRRAVDIRAAELQPDADAPVEEAASPVAGPEDAPPQGERSGHQRSTGSEGGAGFQSETRSSDPESRPTEPERSAEDADARPTQREKWPTGN